MPASGARKHRDRGQRGFGVQITSSGSKSWCFIYTIGGRERLITIGRWPEWTAERARAEARRLRLMVDDGLDPLEERERIRLEAKELLEAPTVADLVERYIEEHLPTKRPRSADEDRALIRDYIRPSLGKLKVADVTKNDVAKLHRAITAASKRYRANRALALMRALFNFAIEWQLRADNPARGGRGGIAMNPEDHREVFLSTAEIARLAAVLDRHPERTTVDLIRLLMMTGCRYGEAANATWSQFDLAAGLWRKPSSHTKAKKQHIVPLSGPALALLAERKGEATGELVFPSRKPARKKTSTPAKERPITTIKTAWSKICRDAGLSNLVEKRDRGGELILNPKTGEPVMVWKSAVRLHDLRHTFASALASGGASLPLIGSLIGHATITTTMRYAHLADDARREAVERVGALVTSGASGKTADVTELQRRGAW